MPALGPLRDDTTHRNMRYDLPHELMRRTISPQLVMQAGGGGIARGWWLRADGGYTVGLRLF